MDSNQELIARLKAEGILTDERVEKAMLRVDRALFVPLELRNSAYMDMPLPIGDGQTISAPHMVAIMSQCLSVGKGMKILEIGAGSGYQAAVIAELTGTKGRVITIERHASLAECARKCLTPWGNSSVIIGNGANGYAKEAPYDRILVACAAESVPNTLASQLKEGGRMLLPVCAGHWQELTLVEKINGKAAEKNLGCPCSFVPLVYG